MHSFKLSSVWLNFAKVHSLFLPMSKIFNLAQSPKVQNGEEQKNRSSRDHKVQLVNSDIKELSTLPPLTKVTKLFRGVNYTVI
jgi:hypothetical protein